MEKVLIVPFWDCQSERKILQSTCPSDSHRRELSFAKSKNACPKSFFQPTFRNKVIHVTCDVLCIFIDINVDNLLTLNYKVMIDSRLKLTSNCIRIKVLHKLIYEAKCNKIQRRKLLHTLIDSS